jgi:hypothetical protein
MSVYPELDGLSLAGLIQSFYGSPIDRKSYATAYYEEVAARIGEHGNDGVRFLMNQASSVDHDEPRLRAVMLGLTMARVDDPWGERLLHAHLGDRRPSIVTGVIDGLTTLHALAAHDRVLALAAHRSPYVRGAVLRYLAALFPDEARTLLLAGLRDRHFVVRESAIDELDEMEAAEAVDAIWPMLNDPHPYTLH